MEDTRATNRKTSQRLWALKDEGTEVSPLTVLPLLSTMPELDSVKINPLDTNYDYSLWKIKVIAA